MGPARHQTSQDPPSDVSVHGSVVILPLTAKASAQLPTSAVAATRLQFTGLFLKQSFTGEPMFPVA
jgi:hypothetical protein